MCRLLGVERRLVYASEKGVRAAPSPEELAAAQEEFDKSRGVYGARKLAKAMAKRKTPVLVSRRRAGRIMGRLGLVSKYTMKRRPKKNPPAPNEVAAQNALGRQYSGKEPLEAVVSDLTYMKVGGKWAYVCLLVDLASRGILGYAVGRKRGAQITKAALFTVKADLRRIKVFHTDNGGEFKNKAVSNILDSFGIARSLSAPGKPLDNAVAESMYNTLKIELGEEFGSMEELELELFDYVNWFNNIRLHGSLGYKTPAECGLPA